LSVSVEVLLMLHPANMLDYC